MLELMQILAMLCGLDYSGTQYRQCVDKSRDCVEKEIKQLSLKDDKKLKAQKKAVFYRCYRAGEI